MTQEEKQLLLIDLCGRLPYGIIYHRKDGANIELRVVNTKNGNLNYADNIVVCECKPYLRPMSSMTEEEDNFVYNGHIEFWIREDYCNQRHLDYRGLIEKGLAIAVTEENNPYK